MLGGARRIPPPRHVGECSGLQLRVCDRKTLCSLRTPKHVSLTSLKSASLGQLIGCATGKPDEEYVIPTSRFSYLLQIGCWCVHVIPQPDGDRFPLTFHGIAQPLCRAQLALAVTLTESLLLLLRVAWHDADANFREACTTPAQWFPNCSSETSVVVG